MALTLSDVYSPQVPGLATVLGSSLGPLRIAQQEAYRQAHLQHQKQAQETKAKAAAEKMQTPPTLNMNGSQWFQPEVDASARDVYAGSLEDYKTKPLNEARMSSKAREAKHNGLTQRAADAGAAIDNVITTARANSLDEGAVRVGMAQLLTDPDTGNPLSAHDFSPHSLATFNQNPKYFDRKDVTDKFVAKQLKEQEDRHTTAARPGQAGMQYDVRSNMFEERNGKPVMEMGPNGPRPKIANLDLWEQAAMRDPKMAAMLREQLDNGAASTADALMRLTHGTMSDDQADAALEALNGQTDSGTAKSRAIVDDLIRSYGFLSKQKVESSPLVVRPPHATAAGKLKPSQATATPTSDFGLSVDDTGVPTTETVDNPNKGGLLNFLTPKILRPTTQTQTANSHYPHVGVSFATEKTPYVPLMVDSNEFTTLGADGTPSHYTADKTNSQVRMNATDRSFVLEVNGKRLGLPKSGTSADAYQEMRRMIDQMTPEQARRAVLKAYYQGTVVDKGKVSGDGTGEKAKVIGYKSENGRLLTDAEAAASKRDGEVLTPVYDTRERQLKVMRPATAQLDAQAARQTPGYNPRQRTAQEADLIHRLEAKGGRVVDPYHTTPAPSTSTRPAWLPTKTTAPPHQKLRIGVADPLGFETGTATDRKPPRIENGIQMTGGKSLGIDWKRGGSVYTPPKDKSGGML
ncbi:MAG: hypothetical protein ACRYFX_13130 [Janthinobacterium lividum]